MKDKALTYLKNGASVIPCKPREKTPTINWKEYTERLPTEDEITKWFQGDENIAMICGKISGYTVIDLDNKSGKDLLEYAKKLGFPETATVKTPSGGYHLYYKYNPKWKTGVRVFEDVDVRNDNSYVILPPSIHPNGGKYELYKNIGNAILPDELGQGRRSNDTPNWNEVLFGVGEGSRNDTAAKVAGLYIARLNPSDAWQALSIWNRQNNPPLPEYELKNVFLSISQRERSKPKELQAEDLKEKFRLITLSQLVDRSMVELKATKASECVSFGYEFLDDKLTGLFPGELMIIGGETGVGKTTLATKMVYNSAKRGTKSVILALEDRLNDYGIKAVYFELGRVRKKRGLKNYPWNEYRKNCVLDKDYQFYIDEAVSAVKNDNVYFIEVEEMMSIDLLEVILDTLTAQGYELFLIDHLHYFDLLKGDSSKADYVESVMIRLKQCQNRNGARILLIAHYRKLNGQKPTDAAFKDSMAIAQNANYTMHLWRDKSDQGTPGETEIFISKSRNPNGEAHMKIMYDNDLNDYICDGYTPDDWENGGYTNEQIIQQKIKNF